jgi:hypothetical protein
MVLQGTYLRTDHSGDMSWLEVDAGATQTNVDQLLNKGTWNTLHWSSVHTFRSDAPVTGLATQSRPLYREPLTRSSAGDAKVQMV